MLYVRLRLLIQRAIAKILPNSETRTVTNQNSALLKLSLDLLPRGELGIGALRLVADTDGVCSSRTGVSFAAATPKRL
jgi:hypothetical protein